MTIDEISNTHIDIVFKEMSESIGKSFIEDIIDEYKCPNDRRNPVRVKPTDFDVFYG